MCANSAPLINRELIDVAAVKGKGAAVVVAIAINVAAQRRLAGTALGAYEITLALFKGDVAEPNLAAGIGPTGKVL